MGDGNYRPESRGKNPEYESLTTDDLVNTGAVSEPGSPEGDRGFRDDFEDGTRDARLYYNGVTESGGVATISGSTNNHTNLLRPVFHYGGRVVCRVRMKIQSGESAVGKLQLRQVWKESSDTQGRINNNGGAFISFRQNSDSNWNIQFQWADEEGNFAGGTRIDDNNVSEGTFYELRLVADTEGNRFEYLFTDNNSIRHRDSKSFTDGDFSNAFTGQVIEAGGNLDVDWFEISGMNPPSPTLPLSPRRVERIIGTESVVNEPVSTPQPKEPTGVKVGDTYYCALVCWDAYSGASNKGIGLWATTNPLGNWRQISRLQNNPSDRWHTPAVVYDVEGNGNLWIIANNQDQRQSRLYYADESNIPSDTGGWNADGPILDDGLLDTKGVIKHDGEWYVASLKYNSGGSSREAVLDKGPNLRSLSRVGVISDEAPQGPDLFPSGDGGWLFMDSSGGYAMTQSSWASEVARADSIDGTYEFNTQQRDSRFAVPGVIYDHALADGDSGWYHHWTTGFHSIKNEEGTGLAKWHGHYIFLFAGGDGDEFAVGAIAVPSHYGGGGELVDAAQFP